MKFIVIDDMATMRKILNKAISSMGDNEVITAEDGKEALAEIVKAHKSGAPIEFIVSDWNMPNMTGIELLEKVKGTKLFADVPFLMVTAESEMENVKMAVQKGVDGFIIKPFNVKQVQDRVNELLEKKGLKAA